MLYFRVIPFRAMSRAWGWLTNCQLPTWARQPIIGLYARTFNCNMEEALDSNLQNYPCLAEFFRRKLKEHVRPIDNISCVVSPSDGTVLNFGRVTAGQSFKIIKESSQESSKNPQIEVETVGKIAKKLKNS